jgi:flagellar hook-associated protein FlgK
MQVRSDIQSDIRNLSIAAPAAERVAVPVDVNVGSAASTMQLDFNTGGGGAGAALNVADTVTINGVQFTFTGAGGRSVAPGGSLQASLQSLVDAINADGTLSPIMTAALDPLNPRINLTAKQAGLGGNAFNVSAALQVGETVDANGAGAPNQNLGATNFINGASATQTAISIAHMNIGPDSKQGLEFIAALKDTTFVIDGYSTLIPAGANTLSSYAGVVTGVLRNQISQAKQSKEVSTLSLSNFTQQYKQVNGISKEEEQQKAIDGANYYRANLWMSSVLKQMRDELFSYLGR